MTKLMEEILALDRGQRLKVAMAILASIEQEESGADAPLYDWQADAIEKTREKLEAGTSKLLSKAEFWGKHMVWDQKE